jgi:hypothetical protein
VSSTTHTSIHHTDLAIIAQTTNGETEKGLSDTYDDYHDYTVSISIDGKAVRTVQASTTKNGSVTEFPNTPSRIQLSLWPAGINGTLPAPFNGLAVCTISNLNEAIVKR